MMGDLFSSLDPAIRGLVELGRIYWCLILFPLFFFLRFWGKMNIWNYVGNWLIVLFLRIGEERKFGKSKGIVIIIGVIFVWFFLINLIGLIPYSLSVSSHLLFTLRFGLSLWIGVIISSVINHILIFFRGFVPDGVPLFLSPFLVIIEIVRVLVRPITLSFRIAANIRTGHVILGLLGRKLRVNLLRIFFLRILLIIFIIVGYTIFEVFVSFIQAYIFSLLICLYLDEHRV